MGPGTKVSAILSQRLRSNCNAIAEYSFKTDKAVATVQLCAGSIKTSGKVRHAWVGSSKVRRGLFVQSRRLFVLRHHRLRAIQLEQWRRGPTIYRELRALGAEPEVARRVAVNSRRWWRNSGMLLNSVMDIAWFDRMGLPRLS